jgi:hypothetical protein
LDWIGLDWIGLDWIGLDWIGLDWIGLDWIGLDWIDSLLMLCQHVPQLLCVILYFVGLLGFLKFGCIDGVQVIFVVLELVLASLLFLSGMLLAGYDAQQVA